MDGLQSWVKVLISFAHICKVPKEATSGVPGQILPFFFLAYSFFSKAGVAPATTLVIQNKVCVFRYVPKQSISATGAFGFSNPFLEKTMYIFHDKKNIYTIQEISAGSTPLLSVLAEFLRMSCPHQFSLLPPPGTLACCESPRVRLGDSRLSWFTSKTQI